MKSQYHELFVLHDSFEYIQSALTRISEKIQATRLTTKENIKNIKRTQIWKIKKKTPIQKVKPLRRTKIRTQNQIRTTLQRRMINQLEWTEINDHWIVSAYVDEEGRFIEELVEHGPGF